MLRRLGVILNNIVRISILLSTGLPGLCQAINVGNLTFSINAEDAFVTKQVINNNKMAKIYRVVISAIDRPGEKEVHVRAIGGELLFSPGMVVLQPGERRLFKFYYNGPQDNKERYYRISFSEIPTQNHQKTEDRTQIWMEPVIVLDTILVVRPRKINFSWDFDKAKGVLKNNGNTWFKLLLKPGCESTEDESASFYLRPGDVLHEPLLQQSGNKYIIYNDKFIKMTDECRE